MKTKIIISISLAVLMTKQVFGAEHIPAIPEMISLSGSALMVNDQDLEFDLLNTRSLPNGRVLTSYRQKFQSIPVWGEKVVSSVMPGQLVPSVTGRVVAGINDDLTTVKPSITPSEAFSIAMTEIIGGIGAVEDDASGDLARTFQEKAFNKKSQLWIYVNDSGKARLVYLINWVVYQPEPSRPFVFIDALTGEVIKHWDGMAYISANRSRRNGQTQDYGYYCNFSSGEVDDSCRMSYHDIETVHMRNRTSGGSIRRFLCSENDHSCFLGAYSSLNDAHFFGSVVLDMYQQWYDMAPLTHKLRMRVHFGVNYENAFWDGSQVTFGDGGHSFHPSVSLDMSAHEVSHGFTEQNSNLIYSGQSGGINEAFSDMAGEAAEFFMTGTNDWQVGVDIFQSGRALRFFDDPARDGRSIGHASDYVSDMDVHFSSGVFNRAFYLIANTAGWDTRKAFDIFVLANQFYWQPGSDFVDGACGVLRAANDLFYKSVDVSIAFDTVGISTSECMVDDLVPSPTASSEYLLQVDGQPFFDDK